MIIMMKCKTKIEKKKQVDIGICKEIQLLESETFLLVEPEILGFEMKSGIQVPLTRNA